MSKLKKQKQNKQTNKKKPKQQQQQQKKPTRSNYKGLTAKIKLENLEKMIF